MRTLQELSEAVASSRKALGLRQKDVTVKAGSALKLSPRGQHVYNPSIAARKYQQGSC
jgi:hypothetical protein